MRKKLDTRFPASRIKKIMQADEDVGKIAMAVPVLVSKALELFLQDLCDRTYDITLRKGAKTLNSLHLRYCVQSYNEYDFLREIANKVPDYGHSDVAGEDKTVTKRRKADEFHESDEESKRSKMENTSSGTRGRGRGRGRSRGRGRRGEISNKEQHVAETESSFAPIEDINEPIDITYPETKDVSLDNNNTIGNSNLNVESEKSEKAPLGTLSAAEATSASASAALPVEGVTEEYPGWSVSDIDKIAIDPSNLAHLSMAMNDDDEDYDTEG